MRVKWSKDSGGGRHGWLWQREGRWHGGVGVTEGFRSEKEKKKEETKEIGWEHKKKITSNKTEKSEGEHKPLTSIV